MENDGNENIKVETILFLNVSLLHLKLSGHESDLQKCKSFLSIFIVYEQYFQFEKLTSADISS